MAGIADFFAGANQTLGQGIQLGQNRRRLESIEKQLALQTDEANRQAKQLEIDQQFLSGADQENAATQESIKDFGDGERVFAFSKQIASLPKGPRKTTAIKNITPLIKQTFDETQASTILHAISQDNKDGEAVAFIEGLEANALKDPASFGLNAIKQTLSNPQESIAAFESAGNTRPSTVEERQTAKLLRQQSDQQKLIDAAMARLDAGVKAGISPDAQEVIQNDINNKLKVLDNIQEDIKASQGTAAQKNFRFSEGLDPEARARFQENQKNAAGSINIENQSPIDNTQRRKVQESVLQTQSIVQSIDSVLNGLDKNPESVGFLSRARELFAGLAGNFGEVGKALAKEIEPEEVARLRARLKGIELRLTPEFLGESRASDTERARIKDLLRVGVETTNAGQVISAFLEVRQILAERQNINVEVLKNDSIDLSDKRIDPFEFKTTREEEAKVQNDGGASAITRAFESGSVLDDDGRSELEILRQEQSGR